MFEFESRSWRSSEESLGTVQVQVRVPGVTSTRSGTLQAPGPNST